MVDVVRPPPANATVCRLAEKIQHLLIRVHDVGLELPDALGASQACQEFQQEFAESAPLKIVMHGHREFCGFRFRQFHVARTADDARRAVLLRYADDARLLRAINGKHLPKHVGRDAADWTEKPVQ